MCVQIVANDFDLPGLRMFLVDQPTQLQGQVRPSATRGDGHRAPTRQWLGEHEDVGRPTTLVFGIHSRGRSRVFRRRWLGRQRRCDLPDQLHRSLVKADDGLFGVVGQLIGFQHIFHGVHELRIRFWWDAPILAAVGLQFIFFNF